ncbi:lipocalin family protein [Brucellaceae bacterium C25G]
MNFKTLASTAAGLFVGYKLYRAHNPKVLKNVEPVQNFELNKYLGKWYEVGRIDNRFERNLINTTATYSLDDHGRVKVHNSGFNPITGKQKNAYGTAVFVRGENEGALKVSFFKPFYGGYNIVSLSDDYEWSIIIGSDRKYFWVLSREPEVTDDLRSKAISIALTLGINPQDIHWVTQDK